MATGIAELVDERIKGLDRTLPKKRLLRGFGALTLGGITGEAASEITVIVTEMLQGIRAE